MRMWLMQGTLPSNQKQPSKKTMWRAVKISTILTILCVYPIAIVGYWAYGDKVTLNLNSNLNFPITKS